MVEILIGRHFHLNSYGVDFCPRHIDIGANSSGSSFFFSPFTLFNLTSGFSYNNNYLFSPYNSLTRQLALPYPEQWSGSPENIYKGYATRYGNTYYNSGLKSSVFDNFANSSLFTSPIPLSQIDDPEDYGTSYGITFSPIISNPFSLFLTPIGGYGSPLYPPPYTPNIIPTPQPTFHCDPADAPYKMAGTWQSEQLTDEEGNTIKGDLSVNKNDKLIKMPDSPLSLGEGNITEFQYTRTHGGGPNLF